MVKVNKFYLLLTLIFGLLALFIGGPYLYLVFYSFIFIFLFSSIYILIIKLFFNVEIIFPRDYYCTGDISQCLTKVNFELFLPIPYIKVYSEAVKYGNSNINGEITNVTKDENRWIRNQIVFEKRGVYNIGKVKIEVFDIFKVISFIKNEDKNINIKVYPKMYGIKELGNGGMDIFLEKYDKNSTNEEPSIIRDVRKYKVGDSLKKVHWKVSAKLNELHVKNSETISGEQYAILLDMNKENFNYEDKLAEEKVVGLAVSLLEYLLSKGISIDIYLNNKAGNMKRVEDRQDFEELMEYIVMNKSDGELKMYEFIHNVIYRIHKSNKIIVVLVSISSNVANSLLALKSYGYDLAVFYSFDNSESKESRIKLEPMLINCTCLNEINGSF